MRRLVVVSNRVAPIEQGKLANRPPRAGVTLAGAVRMPWPSDGGEPG